MGPSYGVHSGCQEKFHRLLGEQPARSTDRRESASSWFLRCLGGPQRPWRRICAGLLRAEQLMRVFDSAFLNQACLSSPSPSPRDPGSHTLLALEFDLSTDTRSIAASFILAQTCAITVCTAASGWGL